MRTETMKKIWIILFIFSFAALFNIPCNASPTAVLVDPVFQFQPLPEGQVLTHEFIVKNQGDTPLNITKVVPP